jgi:hypothetical protein
MQAKQIQEAAAVDPRALALREAKSDTKSPDPMPRFNAIGDFLTEVKSRIQPNQNILIALDFDGPLNNTRVYCENMIRDKVARHLQEQADAFLKKHSSDEKEKFTTMLLEAFDKKTQDQIRGKIEYSRDKTPLQTIIDQVSFGYAMQTSPYAEKKSAIIMGQPSEKETLLNALYKLAKEYPQLLIVCLTARPPLAAKNFEYVMQKLSCDSGLEENVFLELMAQRIKNLGLEPKEYFSKAELPHPVDISAQGMCFASGRNVSPQ